ncbi:hypothetical protein JR316_0011121 [Psilocybe cubensis]|uniref:Uncharacterized protein n=2 Tax=Psilocybe cubensis TaxID=181762 RepID=A0ACB8GP61_PSICU|nr:hypothetical protein JR316_0011121 [Psilocybe cubensis]KAH9477202.1 hypothetical protein JR316_0011121 [Psilocybe cubensis]
MSEHMSTSHIQRPNTGGPVLLLRDPTPSKSISTSSPASTQKLLSRTDKYETAFTNAGYTPHSLGVLRTASAPQESVQRLISIVRAGPRGYRTDDAREVEGAAEDGYGGVIVTSRRSCEAWTDAVAVLRAERENERGRSAPAPTNAGWARVPFYVVGEATADALREVFRDYADVLGDASIHPSSSSGSSTPALIPDIRGASSGSAAVLAPFILADTPHRPRGKLLYLTGDKNRDTLVRILEAGDAESEGKGKVRIEEVQVYRTEGADGFANALEGVLREWNAGVANIDTDTWWVVYFAPSAAAHATPILQQHFFFDASSSSSSSSSSAILNPKQDEASPSVHQLIKPKLKAKVAAIGPTTHDFLRDTLGLRVHVMARKPTADEVVHAVSEYDSRYGTRVDTSGGQ